MSESADIHDDFDHLRERVAELEAIVEDLQADDSTTSTTGFGDWRDQAVLGHLESGEGVSTIRLKNLYREHGDITASTTLRKRVKSLVRTGPFEDTVDHGVFRYTGGGDE